MMMALSSWVLLFLLEESACSFLLVPQQNLKLGAVRSTRGGRGIAPPPSSSSSWTGSSVIILKESAGGGGGGVSQALDLLHKGAKLFQELDSKTVDPQEAEEEALLEEEEEELQRRKEMQENENKRNKEQPGAALQNTTAGIFKTMGNNQTLANNGNMSSTATNSTQQQQQSRQQQQIDKMQQEMQQVFQTKLDALEKRARRLRILLVKKIAAWAFEVVVTSSRHNDSSNMDRKIDKAAFYSGTLLVHLHLAKYVGVAACQPPTREQVDELFYLADADRSGFLNQKEFTDAVLVATAPLTGRIAVYWTLLAILPIVVTWTMTNLTNLLHCLESITVARIPRKIIMISPVRVQQGLAVLQFLIQLVLSRIFFSILVPNIFGRIDRAARNKAYQRSRSRKKASSSLWWLTKNQTGGEDWWSTMFPQLAAVGKPITSNETKDTKLGNWFLGSTTKTAAKKQGGDQESDGAASTTMVKNNKESKSNQLLERHCKKEDHNSTIQENQTTNQSTTTTNSSSMGSWLQWFRRIGKLKS